MGKSEKVRIALAAIQLICDDRWPYLGSSFVRMVPIPSPGLGTFACDRYWRFYYDPAILQDETWTVPEAATVKEHELEHLLGAHAERWDELGPLFNGAGQQLGEKERWKCWASGTDKSINCQYRRWNASAKCFTYEYPLPGSPCVPEEGEPDGKTAEWYTAENAKRIQPPPHGQGGAGEGDGGEGEKEPGQDDGSSSPQEGEDDAPPKAPGAGGDCGSASHGKPRDYELPPPGEMMEEEQEDGTIKMVPAPGLDADDAETMRQHSAMEIASHVAEHGRGSVPAHLRVWAEEFLAPPKINWRQVFLARLRSAMTWVRGMTDYSYGRPSRRQAAMGGVIFPSMVRPQIEIAVLIDTSGSMAGRLERVVSEVEGMCRSAGQSRVTLIGCGAGIHMIKKIRSGAGLGLAACGGTDMRVGIAAVEKLKPRPNICVVLTDAMTPWPVKAPAGMKVIVGVIGSSGTYANRVPSWARTIEIPLD